MNNKGFPGDLMKEASIRGALARAVTWGVPLGKYTGPAPFGQLLGGGGFKRKMLVDNLMGRVMHGNKLNKIERDIIAKGMGVDRNRADAFIANAAKAVGAGNIRKGLSSNAMHYFGGSTIGRIYPSYAATAGLLAPATASFAPIVAAGAGFGLLRNVANRAIGRRALHERLTQGGKLTLSEKSVFDRMREMEQRMTPPKRILPFGLPGVLGTTAVAGASQMATGARYNPMQQQYGARYNQGQQYGKKF